MEKENKKSASGWGGKREGAGAKRKLPDGAKTRSARMNVLPVSLLLYTDIAPLVFYLNLFGIDYI